MIEVMVRADGGKLSGVTAADAESIADLEGDYRAQLTRPRGRSLSQNNLFWGVCQLIADNYETEILQLTTQFVADTLKIGAGHYTAVALADGTYRLQPRSIAFNKMDQQAFNTFMDRAMMVAAAKFGPGLADAARKEMERALAGNAAP